MENYTPDWVAHYSDGTGLSEGPGISSEQIDRDRLVAFQCGPLLVETRQVQYRRRTFMRQASGIQHYIRIVHTPLQTYFIDGSKVYIQDFIQGSAIFGPITTLLVEVA